MDDLVKILLNDILPIFVTLILGYFGGKLHKFDKDQMQGLDKVVLDIALPAALFLSITKATRETLFGDMSLTIASVVVILGMFLLCALIAVKAFKNSLQEAGGCALIVGNPTVGFLGFAVLEPLFGTGLQTGLVVAIAAIVSNAILIPLGIFIINKGKLSGDNSHNPESKNPTITALVNALKQPLCWVPFLAIAIVLVGIRFPTELDPCFNLIAKANSGVAVFAAGLALSTVQIKLSTEVVWNVFYKNLLSPAVGLLVALLLGMRGDLLLMFVIVCALPTAFSGFLIGVRNGVYVQKGAASVASTTLMFIVTMPFWMYVTPIVEKLFA